MEEIKAVPNWELDDTLYTEFTSLRRRLKSAERTITAVNRIRGARSELELESQSGPAGGRRPMTAGAGGRSVHRRQSEIDRRKDKHFLKVGLTLEGALELSKNGTAEDMLMENLGVIRSRIKSDRIENNRVCAELKKEEQTLKELKITLQDLEGEGKAVGMRAVTEEVAAEADDPQRLDRQSSISRRQVYTKDSGLEQLERDLERVLACTDAGRNKCHTYEYLRERLEREAIQGSITTQRLDAELDGATRQYGILKDRMQEGTREMSSRQLELERLEYGMGREMKLWQREIKWLQTKAKTNVVCSQIITEHIDYQDALTAKAASGKLSNLSAKEERMLVKKFVTGRLGVNMSNKNLDSKLKEFEQMRSTYEEVCLQLGTSLDKLDPAEITAPILDYDLFVIQMEGSDAAERAMLDELRREIASCQEELTSAGFSGEYEESRRSTTNRALTTAENACTSAHKRLGILQDEYGYLMEQLQPVAGGMRSLVRRIPTVVLQLEEYQAETTAHEGGGKGAANLLGHQLLHMEALTIEIGLFEKAVQGMAAEEKQKQQRKQQGAAGGELPEAAGGSGGAQKEVGANVSGAALEGIRALRKAREQEYEHKQTKGRREDKRQAHLKHNIRVNSSLKLPKYDATTAVVGRKSKEGGVRGRTGSKMKSIKMKMKEQVSRGGRGGRGGR
jgi:hypothetical protein